ncbi:class II aldolase/adducin family protein [Sphingomonas jatrophae]|uniref:L-fuculose-phosphate aldolase n=1 Tax=Sphingomonas jatrophae TaxID=1166337 RepID=A0A1I6K9Y2_9SPHN|nr:class II aldolase/adducin family protein [Sphingomonas jatrophae]SFR88032.1 L-fuculose-phosphate aldolase [Sphingomonas jatrophae]
MSNLATLPLADARVTEAAEAIAAAGRDLKEKGSLSTRGPGAFNAAVRIDADRFVIGSLKQAIVVSSAGEQIGGPEDKSLREVISVYKAIFDERLDFDAALHTHSPHLTAYAIAHKPFPIRYWSVAKRAGVNEIPLAEWAPRYSSEPVIETLRRHPKTPAALLKNRGLFAWGSNGVAALAALIHSLDEAAEITLLSERIGGPQPLPEGAVEAFVAAKAG